MEEARPQPETPGDRTPDAAEKLRALRERAQAAMEEHRRRTENVGAELDKRIEQLSAEFESGKSAAASPAAPSRDEEVESLRRQVELSRLRHEQFVAQLAEARRQLNSLLAQPCSACQAASSKAAAAETEAQELRQRLDAALAKHQEDHARHEKFSEQLAAAQQAIADLQTQSGDTAGQLRAELAQAIESLAAAQERLAGSERDMEMLHAECTAQQARADAAQEKAAEAAAQLDAQRDSRASLEADLQHARRERDELKRARQEAAGELARLREAVTAAEKERSAERSGADAAAAERQRLLETTQQENSSLAAELAVATTQREELQSALAATQRELLQFKEQATTEASEVSEQRAALEKALSEAKAEIEQLRETTVPRVELESLHEEHDLKLAELESQQEQLAKLREELAQQVAASLEESPDLQALCSERDGLAERLEQSNLRLGQSEADAEQLRQSVSEAESEAARLRETTAPRSELESLEQKFDLALADVQKLKRENGELRDELARRPEASDAEAPELVALRSERDALAERVAELESVGPPAVDAQADADDLHRRFEMAVDDVRQLKQENATLREQLAAAGSSKPKPASSDGPLDWAAQRARLMELLEQEDDTSAEIPERRQERATIEETIAQTDRILAEKDRELADLRAAHISRGHSDVIDRELERILGADDQVAAERERLARMQSELHEKLRAAELELSVERARLAREQATLKEKMFELQKHVPAPDGREGDGNKLRRRWLAAMGLGDEPEQPPAK